MKKIYILLFMSAIILPAGLQARSSDGLLSVRLVIESATTAEEIQQMQQFMKDNGYSLTIEDITYNAEGKIQSIHGEVDFGKASGTFGTDDLIDKVIVIRKSLINKMSIEIKPAEKQ